MAEFAVLGPVEARGPAGEVRLGAGATVRVVLAILVLRAGQVVSRDALVDALWPDDPPPSARQTVESYVSRLRRALREAGLEGAAIESVGAGYRLAVDGYAVDRSEFAALVASGHDARTRGDPAAAASLLGEALALWRGPALDGVADRPALSADAAALDQQRVLALEAWAEAQLDRGRTSEVIATLRAEAGHDPRRERLHELLMLAFYRAGAQAEALRHYAEVRRRLVDELGLEPGRRLRETQERILRQDPALDHEPAATTNEPAPPDAPASARRGPGLNRVRVAAVAGAAAVVAAAAGVLVAAVGHRGSADRPATVGPAVVTLGPVDDRAQASAALPATVARIAAGLGARWVTAPDDGTVLRVDRDGHLTQAVRVGHGPVGVAVGGGDVWVALPPDRQVVRIDVPSNRVVQRIALGTSPSELAVSAGVVWVADALAPTVSRIDVRTGTVLGTTTLHGRAGGLAVGFGAVWATLPDVGRVVQLDPRTGRVRDEIPVGSGPGPIVAGAAGVWVANTLDSTVSLIDPTRTAVTFTQQVRGTAGAMTALGRHLWVAARDAPALTRLAADEPARVIALPSPATALAADGDRVLAALGPSRLSHRGGTVRVKSSIQIRDVDTHACCNTPPALRNASYDGLLAISVAPGAVGVLVPNLALAVPRAQDGGRTYTFRLRPGLRYWTGRRVRASDFRRGLELAARTSPDLAGYLHALPGARRCGAGGRCDLRAAIESNDETGTVTVHLFRPDPEFLWAMALSLFAPAPTDDGPIPGTGPYRIARLVPNRLVELRRNPYFRERAPAAQPDGYPDRILWEMGARPERSVADVLAGRADYTDDPATQAQMADLRVRFPSRLHIEPVAGDEYASLNTRAPPFDDVRVRRALAFAVDRGALARKWGSGAQPLCQIVPASVPGHVAYCPYTRRANAAGTWSAPDLAKARALIAASGTQGMTIDYFAEVNVVGEIGLVDSYMSSLLRRLSYKVVLHPIGPDTTFDHFQIGTGSWWADVPSPSQWMRLLACDALTKGEPRFCDPAVDRLTQRAQRLQMSDPATANRLWARADRRITDQAAWIPVIQPAWVSIVSARVGGYHYVPTIGVLAHRLWVR
jgi:peptide/nickel transport system substrate-binding protein